VNLTLRNADRAALKGSGLFLTPPFGTPSALRDTKAVKAFFEAGADVAAKDPAGRTLLMLAVSSDDVPVETLEVLIGLGVDINGISSDGKTALDFAQQVGRQPVVDLLKKFGAKPGRKVVQASVQPKPATSESSEFDVTALSMRAIQIYAPKALRTEYEKSVWRTADWLRSAKPKSTADRAGQILGLTWAGDSKDSLKKLASQLLAEQRADGGWAQLPTMTSDAFATGQVLTALHLSGAVSVSDPTYQRGVKYLLVADGLVSIEEAMNFLSVSRSTVYELMDR
jgi:hypothetical protein